ncbi:GumC family protein [Camelimonas abortus]|uniref:GumC family protein n=1 Tax=Camelimonas abortus TaxID=1017184 RepID=UPI0035EDEDB2
MTEPLRDSAILLLLAAETAALVRARRRYGLTGAATLTGCWTVGAQLIAWLALHGVLSHDMTEVYGGADPEADLARAIWCAGGLFALVWALQAAVAPARAGGAPRPPRPVRPRAFLRWRRRALWAVAAAWSVAFAGAAATLDLQRLWFTSGYLELTDPELMTRGALSGLAFTLLPYCGALAAAAAALALAPPRPDPVAAAATGAQAAVTTLWLLAAHSRAAALAPLAFMLVTLLTAPRAWFRLALCGALGAAALGGALAGRGLGAHGLASLPELPALLAGVAGWGPRAATNLAEGVFAVAAGLGEWRNAAPGVRFFPDDYVWLSLSPLPSALDGFSEALGAQVRLHEYAPMPGYVELLWFGPPPAAAFLFILAVAMGLAARAGKTVPLAQAGAEMLLAAAALPDGELSGAHGAQIPVDQRGGQSRRHGACGAGARRGPRRGHGGGPMTVMLPLSATPAPADAARQSAPEHAVAPPLWTHLLLHHRTVLAGAAAGMIAACLFLLAFPPVWRASTDVELTGTPPGSAGASPSAAVSEGIIENQGVMATSQPVLARAAAMLAETGDELTVLQLRGCVSVRRLPRTLVWRITAKARSPALALRIADAVAGAWTAERLASRREMANRLVSQLNARLPELAERVRETEAAAAQWRRQHGLAPEGEAGASLGDRQLALLNERLAQARAATLKAKARLEQLRPTEELHADGGVATPEMRSLQHQMTALAREEAALAGRYTAQSPERRAIRAQIGAVSRAIRAERERFARALRMQVAEAERREQELREALNARGGQEASGAVARLRELERQAAASRAAYDQALTQLHAAQLAGATDAPAARVMSPATAEDAPALPRPAVALSLGVAAGGALALLGAALHMRMRDPCLSARLLAHDLEVERIAAAPLLRPEARTARGHVMHPATVVAVRPQSRFAEGFRALRQLVDSCPAVAARPGPRMAPCSGGLGHGPRRRGRIVLVTSAGPGEGKTTTAIGLGLTMLAAGRRTLLVDADPRRAGLSDYFGLQAHCGLLDMLQQTAIFAEASVRRAGLTVTPAGVGDGTCALSLADLAVGPLLRRLTGVFDEVIVDAPPLDVTEDAAAVLQSADVAVLAVRWARTPRLAAVDAAARIRRAGKPCAVMLTQVDFSRLPGSGPFASHGAGALHGYFHD